MAVPDAVSSTLAAGSKVGRAFSVVSLVPSLFLVLLVWVVVASGAVGGTPDPERVQDAISRVSLGSVGAALVLAFLVGYVLHPVQYALTQLLEGYWGTSRVGQALMVSGVRRNRRKKWQLEEDYGEASDRVEAMLPAVRLAPLGDELAVPHLVRRDQLYKALGEFPDDTERMMPTRLGNVLRRHEDLAGAPYGLPGIEVVPAVSLVASPDRTGYMSEASEQLDVTVSVCTVTALGTVIVAAATLTDGWWLLTALVPYLLCLVAYRGAVNVAHAYGLAMRRMVDLDRFALYEALHLRLPADSEEEDRVSAVVSAHLVGARRFTRFDQRRGDAKPDTARA